MPPTLQQVVSNVPLGGVRHRSVALAAPATFRCTTFVPAGGRLRVAMGFEGQGEGDARIIAARDGEPPVELRSVEVHGGDRAEWTPVDLALDSFAGKLVTLELRAATSSPRGRVLFGDPTLYVSKAAAARPPHARIVVVVVASGLDRSRLENREVYPTLTELGRSATKFTAHRSPTTLSAGVVATLLTGVPPRAHGVEDAGARLSGALTTLGVAARDGSIQTAMFTGCPPTFEAFGFARGWDKYAMFSPVEAAPAVAPLTEAAA